MSTCPKCERGGTGPHPKFCTPEMRFWRKVRFMPSGCWEWQGADNGVGYGIIRHSATAKEYAHRFSYTRTFGPLAPDQVVRHKCDNPRCVRAAHLEPGTQLDNNRDMRERARFRPTPRHTHCKRGHAFSPENTARGKDGTQRCRECGNAARRKVGGYGPRARHERAA